MVEQGWLGELSRRPEVMEFYARWGLLMRILERQDEDKSDEQLIAESDNWERLTITKGGG